YTNSPPESGYYGGVTSSGVDMTAPGSAALNTSEAGKIITESIVLFLISGYHFQPYRLTLSGGIHRRDDSPGNQITKRKPVHQKSSSTFFSSWR
ncbi:hypothetical protein PSW03_21030, partial [Shigella flexneri]|nr:hypothetical protein [Shigella flexneri]